MDSGLGAYHMRDGELWCEEVPLSRIAQEVGTPTYVYTETGIRRRYQELADALAALPCRVFYSVKANSNLSLLRLIRSLGAGADVVSRGELYRASRAGYEGERILFGGVGKRTDELAAALDAGVLLINVESESELRRIDALAGRNGVEARVAIRVNPGIAAPTHDYTQTGHYDTKFGVSLEDAVPLYELAVGLGHVAPMGVYAHIGSQILSAEPYRRAVDRLAEIARSARRAGADIRYIDIGGGFGVSHEGEEGIDLSDVVETLGPVARELEVTCFVEPGRWLVAPAGVLLARVLYNKRIGDRSYAVTDTGSNDFIRPSYYGAYHPIEPVVSRPATTVTDVVGPVCESGDFLGRGLRLPDLREGDLLAVGFTGAYGFVMSSNYNSRPRAAEVMVRDTDYRVVRRRESLADLVAGEDESGL